MAYSTRLPSSLSWFFYVLDVKQGEKFIMWKLLYDLYHQLCSEMNFFYYVGNDTKNVIHSDAVFTLTYLHKICELFNCIRIQTISISQKYRKNELNTLYDINV